MTLARSDALDGASLLHKNLTMEGGVVLPENQEEAENPQIKSRHLLVPWSVQEPRSRPVYVRGQGCYLFDDKGQRYLDLSSGYMCVSLGHGHPEMLRAIQMQSERLCWAPTACLNDVRIGYAEALSKIAPWDDGARVHFACGGAEANDDALKIARMITGRLKILTAYRSYHGATIGGSSLTGIDRWRDAWPGLPGIVKFFAPYPYRSPFHTNDPAEEAERALDHLERIVSHEGANNIAAIMIEPVTGSSGVVVYPEGYLLGLRKLCDHYGMLLIFDEVVTGFGRVGKPFAAQRLGVTPDLITFAKGASSAYVPLGGVLVRESLARHFDTRLFDVGHTHAGHVLAVAAGLAALNAYIQGQIFERALSLESELISKLSAMQRRRPIVGDVRGLGALFGIELVQCRDTKQPLVPWHSVTAARQMEPLYQRLRRRGVCVHGRYNILLICPPLTIEEDELAHGLAALEAALEDTENSLELFRGRC